MTNEHEAADITADTEQATGTKDTSRATPSKGGDQQAQAKGEKKATAKSHSNGGNKVGNKADGAGQNKGDNKDAKFVTALTDREEDFAAWYQDLVYKTGLADESPVRGCMVIRPYGYALWENMVAQLDGRIKATGHENLYFPLFIPMGFLEREAEHVEGFAPEVAVVTHAGGEELTEPLVVRPTSETIIGHMYSQWVHSYRDLPLLYNQWANVVRWEKRTRPFLRTSEFLWQEGHTVHRTEQEAEDETLLILTQVYQDFIEHELAIPVIPGRKSESEKFPGALRTYSLEALMADGRALQSATSHNLGQNFARTFDISFQDADGETKYAWTTSWGASTRLIGGIILTHSDDSGLRLPPRVAPIQAVIVPIWRKEEEREAVAVLVSEIERGLRAEGVRVKSDWREERPGFKYNDWEFKGVPIRIEIGPRDAAQGHVVLVPRTDRTAKRTVAKEGVGQAVRDLLVEVQQTLYDQALAFRQARTYRVTTYDEFRALLADRSRQGFVEGWWCGDAECEARVKAETQATIRCLPLDHPAGSGPCIACGNEGKEWAVFAKAY